MNCIISSETTDVQALKAQLEKVPSMDGLALSGFVSCSEAYESGDASSPYRIALLDFGVKQSIVRCLVERNCFVKVFPMNSDAKEILDFRPDGIMYSNGPGDPSAMPASIALVNELIATGIPGFGICLGHQLIGLSQGLKTVKMFNGHRGINHPVKNLISGKSEITSQNHGFVISKESIEQAANAEITHVHLNDQTVAGIRLKQFPVFSVQYHPEASAGPHDSRYLFDQFITNIANGKTTTENKRA
jgi:carbamoyl-phosphate synthase small subunit